MPPPTLSTTITPLISISAIEMDKTIKEVFRQHYAIIAALACLDCGPDLSKVHIAACMRTCDNTMRSCVDTANVSAEGCAATDSTCQRASIVAAENCLTTCLDCIDSCVVDLEQTLK